MFEVVQLHSLICVFHAYLTCSEEAKRLELSSAYIDSIASSLDEAVVTFLRGAVAAFLVSVTGVSNLEQDWDYRDGS